MCLITNYEDDEIITLFFKQMYYLSIKDSKENDKLARIIITYKNHVTSLEHENERIIDEKNELGKTTLKTDDMKCKTCDFLKIKIKNLYETLIKFTKERYNIDTIISNQIGTYNKCDISHLT